MKIAPITPQQRIGQRVRLARAAKGWSPEELAQRLQFRERSAVSAIESGKRAPSLEELQAIYKLTGRDMDYFTDPLVLTGEERFSWRVALYVPQTTLDAFEAQAKRWIGLAQHLLEQAGSPHGKEERPTLQLEAHSSYEEARVQAEELGHLLDLGPVPAKTLVDKIEQKLHVPVLYVGTLLDGDKGEEGRGISGAACHTPGRDFILVNRYHPPGVRLFNIAHELFHVLTWERMVPEHRESDGLSDHGGRQKDLQHHAERLADNFAAALLMPQDTLDRWVGTEQTDDTKHLLGVAESMRVTPAILGWRLFGLQRINATTRQKLAEVEPHRDELPLPFSEGFVHRLHSALSEGTITARRAASTTGLDLYDREDEGGLPKLFLDYGLPLPYSL